MVSTIQRLVWGRCLSSSVHVPERNRIERLQRDHRAESIYGLPICRYWPDCLLVLVLLDMFNVCLEVVSSACH